ncbi:BREX-3 system P-loop-containing protein BrxF [Thermoactinomyces mirandus]|uniref:BREX-3 system P-loop-containing protein BrxF n=1 Tax=Thermoactinomyces mirandus TaxID=2756294 RepID=A0A7W2ASL2_9BACL|nr:BREX-3 system P-loop-containing protein BrxF [Thermoactinomyces mirandus]MBA4603547.1 BREX-3 system P-loop-containing protein BrxF [Thermoactinomyces mirandus]
MIGKRFEQDKLAGKEVSKINTQVVEAILTSLKEITRHRHQLIFLAGDCGKYDFRTLAEKIDAIYLNLSLELSHMLMEIPVHKRPRKVDICFREILTGYSQSLFLLDHIDVLFDSSLQLNPGELLENMSRKVVFVIPWYGQVTDSELIYADPGHLEHVRIPINEAMIIQI